ncbi:MAG: DUF4433 domain-containing protein [Gammaproteobacteria bacterium]|nr:DUF4433 domain-containing protein [Gammaproteobacteria bacterium]
MPVPRNPKIYHIVHVDRLPSIVKDGFLWCDAEISRSGRPGTTIGMGGIKERRLALNLSSHPDLHVGYCVPFYFCPRSVMLFLIHKSNHQELSYHDGQVPIVHLEADLRQTVSWAEEHNQRWAFTCSNAGTSYFEDYCNLAELEKINWESVQAQHWSRHKEGKQAEFLIERRFPWELISRIGVQSPNTRRQVIASIQAAKNHRPSVEIKKNWYY